MFHRRKLDRGRWVFQLAADPEWGPASWKMSCLKFAHMIPPKAHEEISKTFQGASFSDFKFLSGMSALDSDGNIFTRQKFLHIADGVGAKMENARGQHGIGFAFDQHFGHVFQRARAAAGHHRHAH